MGRFYGVQYTVEDVERKGRCCSRSRDELRRMQREREDDRVEERVG